MPNNDPAALEETWRKRLAAAEQAYHQSAEQLRMALQENARSQADPDRAPAVLAARRQKAEARAEYLAVLRIFTDLVLRGKSPGAQD